MEKVLLSIAHRVITVNLNESRYRQLYSVRLRWKTKVSIAEFGYGYSTANNSANVSAMNTARPAGSPTSSPGGGGASRSVSPGAAFGGSPTGSIGVYAPSTRGSSSNGASASASASSSISIGGGGGGGGPVQLAAGSRYSSGAQQIVCTQVQREEGRFYLYNHYSLLFLKPLKSGLFSLFRVYLFSFHCSDIFV
jgi:hypothetical protein